MADQTSDALVKPNGQDRVPLAVLVARIAAGDPESERQLERIAPTNGRTLLVAAGFNSAI